MVNKMDTKSTKYHNDIAHKYENEYQTPYLILYLEITWEFIKKYLPSNKNLPILDAGGGTGYFSRKLAELGYTVVCTDVAVKMLEVGKKLIKDTSYQGKIDFVVSDIIDMKEFKDNTFSMSIAEGDPVGYCGNPQKAVSELARVTQKGGAILVSVDSLYPSIGQTLQRRQLNELSKLLKTHISDFSGQYPQYNFTVQELIDLYTRNHISVDKIIGKPVFTRFLSGDKNELLADEQFYKKIFELEIQFNSEPSLVGCAGHIEIAGFKK